VMRVDVLAFAYPAHHCRCRPQGGGARQGPATARLRCAGDPAADRARGHGTPARRADRKPSAAIDQSNDGLAEICLVARQPGTLSNAVIDVWIGQIATLDLSQLPEHLGRVVVWDEVRGDRALSRDSA
jgi:hypothetical protein